MRCIPITVRSTHPLYKFLHNLKIQYRSDIDNHKIHKAVQAAGRYYGLTRAIWYAGHYTVNDFIHIAHNSKWSTKSFMLRLPSIKGLSLSRKEGLIKVHKIQLIKKVKDAKTPIYELRLGEINGNDFGFRCIFFITKYHVNIDLKKHYYQCYSTPFQKINEKYLGNLQTDDDINHTMFTFHLFCDNPVSYYRDFLPNNIINEKDIKELQEKEKRMF